MSTFLEKKENFNVKTLNYAFCNNGTHLFILLTARYQIKTILTSPVKYNIYYIFSSDIKEDDIRRIVTSYTFRFLKKVFEEYQDKTGEEFEKLVDKKCKGDSKKAFKAICKILHLNRKI